MSQEQIAQSYARAIQDQDFETLGSLMHPDIVARFPQSGETIRGRDNYVTMLESYPDLPEAVMSQVSGNERTAVVPSSVPFSPPTVTVFGGDRFIVEGASTYPDGATFHVVAILHLQGQQVIEETSYYAAPFDPPEWRQAWVELDPA